jgi:hypothetical protein
MGILIMELSFLKSLIPLFSSRLTDGSSKSSFATGAGVFLICQDKFGVLAYPVTVVVMA